MSVEVDAVIFLPKNDDVTAALHDSGIPEEDVSNSATGEYVQKEEEEREKGNELEERTGNGMKWRGSCSKDVDFATKTAFRRRNSPSSQRKSADVVLNSLGKCHVPLFES